MPHRVALELCIMVQLSEMTNGSDSSPLSPPRHHTGDHTAGTLMAHLANGKCYCDTSMAHFLHGWRTWMQHTHCGTFPERVTRVQCDKRFQDEHCQWYGMVCIANAFFHPADTFLQNVADGLCCFDSMVVYLYLFLTNTPMYSIAPVLFRSKFSRSVATCLDLLCRRYIDGRL